VILNGISCAVLGHGVTSKKENGVLGHSFFGNWKKLDTLFSSVECNTFGQKEVRYTRDPITTEINGISK